MTDYTLNNVEYCLVVTVVSCDLGVLAIYFHIIVLINELMEHLM